ncbi:hypothetical protein [Caballeronia sp. ATUFL_M2_KS44]|uniref:hypothetical protein n=1 Tax=Caballeronia sp. ATUFL_M2_KS44 TaxID=2921767 RepID=UPI00202789B4|nr:hypothetical protein [Caballeronia sp. ATUFL_M2_KS44]
MQLSFPDTLKQRYRQGMDYQTRLENDMEVRVVVSSKRKKRQPMHKDNFLLPEAIRAPLADRAEKLGCTKADIVRMALRQYLGIDAA